MNVTKNVWQTFFISHEKCGGGGGVTLQYLPLYGPWFLGIRCIGTECYRDKG